MRTALASLLLGVFPLARPARADTPATQVVETAHYRLEAQTDAATAAEWGRVLEALYAQEVAFFGKAPRLRDGERMRVRFFDTRDAWAAAMQADRLVPPTGAGGYYAPGHRTAYLYRQPTRTFTRILLAHEATHQLHYLARTRNAQPDAQWYREGIAEYLSWHTWDGETLRLGASPRITLSDYPAKALAAVTADGFDLQAVVEGKTWPGRPVAWALLRYLATGRDGKPLAGFESFCRRMDAGGGVGPLFKRCFEPPRALEKDLVAWLRREQQPWTWVFNEWEDLGGNAFHGFAGVVSACRLKGETQRLTARLEVPREGPWRGGLLLHHGGAGDYTVALVDQAGHVRIDRRVGERWQLVADGSVAGGGSPPAEWPLEAVRGEGGVTLRVGERTFGPFDLPASPFGLALDHSDLVFRDVAWQLTGDDSRGR